jgi:GDSL-like lipase/acylhydrolase family protein
VIRKLFLLALPATVLTGLGLATAIEAWVRWHWDHRRGTPGFYESDPARIQRLSPGYNGWFAGVPVRINSLGFRDPRDYDVRKAPGTFRILVLGDSVTFGHGSLFETSYPYLLEQRLKAWQPGVDWQVWNLGVPGYNTRQELRYLQEVGDAFEPDLVIVGFYPNDFDGNDAVPAPTPARRLSSGVQRLMQRHLYSYEFYKRLFLTVRWKLLTSEDDRRRLEHLATEGDLLSAGGTASNRPEQQLTEAEYFDDEQVRNFVCIGTPKVDTESPGELSGRIQARTPDIAPWLDAVSDLRRYAHDAGYPIVFFLNMAPNICTGQDRFYDAGALAENKALLEVFGHQSPAVSSARAFLHHRPSQMPGAYGHSIGNANRLKADVLFEYLRTATPPLLPDS